MTTEEFQTQQLGLLTEIRDLLKAGSGSRGAAASGGKPAFTTPDLPWCHQEWPAFTYAKAIREGKNYARTLGESVTTEPFIKSLRWWADNYQPKEYKGKIQDRDVEFRNNLTLAVKWLDGDKSVANAKQPPAQKSDGQDRSGTVAEPKGAPMGMGSAQDEEPVPFGPCQLFN